MTKNHLLLVLACLNCVHTTHAVEKSAETQNNDQDNGQEILDELRERYELQNLRGNVGILTKNVEVWRDAGIQREKIMQKVCEHRKDALSPNDPRRPLYESWIDRGRDAVKELGTVPPHKLSRLLEKRQQAWVDNTKQDPDLASWSGRSGGGDVPQLFWVLHPVNTTLQQLVIDYDQDMKKRAKKYPDIAEQRRDLYRKMWAHNLNAIIKNDEKWAYLIKNKEKEKWIGNINIGAMMKQLDESNTEIGRDMKETILNTLRNNLIGEDQDLKEKTIELLDQDPVLAEMLNCVHTTHADTQIINQGNGQESLDELKEQYHLHNLRMLVAIRESDVEMLRNVAIQREEIMQKVYAHMKDALSPNDKRRPLYESLIDIRRDIVKDLSNLQPDDSKSLLTENQNTRFINKIREWVDSGKINKGMG